MKQLIKIAILICLPLSASADNKSEPNIEKIYSNFIKVFNTNNFDIIDAFVTKQYSKRALHRWQGAGQERYAGYTIDMSLFHSKLKLLTLNPLNHDGDVYRLSATVHSANTDMKYQLNISVEDKPPFNIDGWYLRAQNKQTVNNQKISEEEMITSMQEYVNFLANNQVFSGTLLIGKPNQILHTSAHGLASRRYDIKNNIDTKFQIGSMNKMFTAVATLQLVEAGKVNLDDQLIKYVDRKYFSKGAFDKITIRQLLTHTSGLGGNPDFGKQQSHIRSLTDSLGTYQSIKLDFEPGTQRRYSSSGMRMLGHVIEKAAGIDYYSYIDRYVYKQAGMKNSGSYDLDVPIKNTARNYWYYPKTRTITENLMLQGVKGGPAGGGYSTVKDLFEFAKALTSHELLSKSLTEEAITAKPALHSPYYGYGFSVRGKPDNRIVGHNGSHLGMSAQLNIYLDKGYVLAVLGNSPSAATPVVAKFNQLIEQLN